jgi:hypothetical protein
LRPETEERGVVFSILRAYTNDESKIVETFGRQALVDLAREHESLGPRP